MNKPTYSITGISQEHGLGKNRKVTFKIYESNPPMIGTYYYSRKLGCGVYVMDVKKVIKELKG